MYRRILLKLSGEALSAPGETFCFEKIEQTARQLKKIADLQIQMGVVLGGGNIWRGRSAGAMERNRADQMGMLSTAINAIAMQDVLLQMGCACTVLSAVDMPRFCNSYTSREADMLLQNGHIVLFACGSGHPYFSTDTAAALRACEIGADVLLLAKNVDAIYSDDPHIHKDAIRYEELTYKQVIEQNLKATDLTAITLCSEQNIPILAFGLNEEQSILRAAKGEKIGTRIVCG